jgi:ribonuclease PH
MPRGDGRTPEQIRPVRMERGFLRHCPGSCLYRAGGTTVVVSAHVSEGVPPFLEGKGEGWLTAEYAMLPGSTPSRKKRGPDGRSTEIQRLIGRSLRAVLDRKALGPWTIHVDADVLEADGGTRTAAITGAWVALHDCIQWMKLRDMVKDGVLRDQVAAVSCGLYNGQPVLDLDYAEDSNADADSNFVMTGSGGIVEVQGTAETVPFSQDSFDGLMALARKGIGQLVQLQKLTVA